MMNDEEKLLDKPTVLVVDDTPENLTLMGFLLKDRYMSRLPTVARRLCALRWAHLSRI